MPKQISFNYQYTHAMFADFIEQEEYPMLIFFESKEINVKNVLKFRCTSSQSNMMKQNIINSNAGSILISESFKNFLLNVLPVDSIQYIESSLKCKDGTVDKVFLINSLLTENIIDIDASEKQFFSK